MNIQTLFNIQGQTAVITGGSGVLGRAMARAMAQDGANVAILSLHAETSEKIAGEIVNDGGRAIGLPCDVTDHASLVTAQERIMSTYGPLDILVNGAGGNRPLATTSQERSFFDLDTQAIKDVFDLNFTGTLLSCQVFGKIMAERGQGCIVNIASMNSLKPLTRIPAYSAAKAAVVNFTQWLAVHMAQEYSPLIRVNAMAPGFFLTEQNRFLMTDAQSGGIRRVVRRYWHTLRRADWESQMTWLGRCSGSSVPPRPSSPALSSLLTVASRRSAAYRGIVAIGSIL